MIIVDEVIKTCNACPAQWSALTRDGLYLYVRYRWGHLNIGVGRDLQEAIETAGTLLSKQIGDGFDGVMSYERLIQVTEGLLVWPNKETRR